ncbi:MAG: ABC-three component system middle component 6 [Pirellulales bacterium]
MILPNKHIRLSESLLGVGAFVLSHCTKPRTVDSLWYALGEAYDSGQFPAYHTFDNLLLSIAFLYSIGAIEMIDDGRVQRCV